MLLRKLEHPTIGLRLFAKALVFVLISSVLFPLFLPLEPAHADRVAVTVVIDRVTEIIDPDPDPWDPTPGNYYADVRIGGFPNEDNRQNSVQSSDLSPGWRFSKVVERGIIPIRIALLDEDDFPWTDDVMDISRTDEKLHVNLNLDLRTGRITSPAPDIMPSIVSPSSSAGSTTSISLMSQGDDDRDPSPEVRQQLRDTFFTEEGGEPARITFTVSFTPSTPSMSTAAANLQRMPNVLCNPPQTGGIPLDRDTDRDFIPDRIEMCGLFDATGRTLIFDMRRAGADPCRKTILIEIDYMHNDIGSSYRPSEDAISQLIDTFRRAPVDAVPASQCPYARYGFPMIPQDNSRGGVNLIIDPHSTRNTIPVSNQASTPSDFQQIMNQNFQRERWPFFHYVLSVNAINPGGPNVVRDPSGVTGMLTTPEDFIVAIEPSSEPRRQAAEIMHELGHTLGLKHGGNDDTDCKPNYLSIMSSTFAAIGGIPTLRTDATAGSLLYYKLDYSRESLRPLAEDNLNELSGIQDGNEHYTIWGYPGPEPSNTPLITRPWVGRGSGPLNWDLSTDNRGQPTLTGSVVADINNLSLLGCGPSPGGILRGFNDWAALNFMINRNVPGFRPQLGPTVEDAEKLRQIVDAYFNLQPKISISSSPDNSTGQGVVPGQTITYTVTVENLGKLPASQVEIMNVFPDGKNETRMILDIPPGGSVIEIFNYTVPTKIIDPITPLNNSVGFTETMSPRIPDSYKDPKALATTISMPVNVSMTNEDLLVTQNLTSNLTSPPEGTGIEEEGVLRGESQMWCINCNGNQENMTQQIPNMNDTTTIPESEMTSGDIGSEMEPVTEPGNATTPGHWWDTETLPPPTQERTSTSTGDQGTADTTAPQEANMTGTTEPDDTGERVGGGGFFGQQ